MAVSKTLVLNLMECRFHARVYSTPGLGVYVRLCTVCPILADERRNRRQRREVRDARRNLVKAQKDRSRHATRTVTVAALIPA